jgi:LysR family glycine cleavage system transcriptional activator
MPLVRLFNRMLTLRIGVCMPRYQALDLISLRAFEAAARHRSMQLAGGELHVTPGAVSRHVLKLERELGCRLFDRYHRRIALTDDGESLLVSVAAGLSQIRRAMSQLKTGHKPDRLVISVDPDFASLWLVPRLDDFYAMAPNISVEISAEVKPNLLLGPRIDCAIHYAKAGVHLKNGESLFRSRLFPVYAPCLREAPLRSLEDLRHHRLLHDRTYGEWQEFIQGCRTTINLDLSGPIFSETAHCMEAAVRGQGVAIGDDFLAAKHLSEGRLVVPFDSDFPSKNEYYFIVPDRTVKHPGVAVFRRWLLQSIARLRSDLSICRSAQPQLAAGRH